jgi:hypothetical protein
MEAKLLTDTNIVAALVGAAAALLFTAGREWFVQRRRRKDVASAIVWELRLRERKLTADLEAATGHKIVVFDPPPSELVFSTFLNDLPSLGGAVFAAIHDAYAQYRQVAYIKARLQPRFETPGVYPADNLLETYLAATRQGISKTQTAILSLRGVAPRDAFNSTLPAVTNLTEIEELFYRRTGHTPAT